MEVSDQFHASAALPLRKKPHYSFNSHLILTEVFLNMTEIFLTLTEVFRAFSSVVRQMSG